MVPGTISARCNHRSVLVKTDLTDLFPESKKCHELAGNRVAAQSGRLSLTLLAKFAAAISAWIAWVKAFPSAGTCRRFVELWQKLTGSYGVGRVALSNGCSWLF